MTKDKDYSFELYLIRHAESLTNAGIIPLDTTGLRRYNSGLSERGQQQASLLGQRLSTIKFNHILASSLSRAVRTAGQIAGRQPAGGVKTIEIIPELSECGIPELDEDFSLADLQNDLGPDHQLSLAPHWQNKDSILYFSDQDTDHDHFARAAFIADYLKNRFNSQEKVAVVAHCIFNRYLICHLLGLEEIGSFRLAYNTSVSKFVFSKENGTDPTSRMFYFNDVSHLLEQLPADYH